MHISSRNRGAIQKVCQCMLQECLGIRLFEHVGVPNKMKQPNEHFLSYCSTFLEMSVFCFWALFSVSKEGSGTVDERSATFGNGNAVRTIPAGPCWIGEVWKNSGQSQPWKHLGLR